METTNEYEPLKIFLSHSSRDYPIISKIKSRLEEFGLNVFLAHKDIAPSQEWQGQIENSLRGCDVLIAVLTNNFKGSDWTDQEVGIAYGLNKKIISLIVDLTPYGFLGKWQGFRFKTGEKEIDNECFELIKHIKDIFPERIKETFFQNLSSISNYGIANLTFELLDSLKPFSKKELNFIFEKSMDKGQILRGFISKRYLINWFDSFKEDLDEDIKKISEWKLDLTLDKEWAFRKIAEKSNKDLEEIKRAFEEVRLEYIQNKINLSDKQMVERIALDYGVSL